MAIFGYDEIWPMDSYHGVTSGRLCLSLYKLPSIQRSWKYFERCEAGEVCSIYWDGTGYTGKCLKKKFCYMTKNLVGGHQCWDCCDTDFCNDHCTVPSTTVAMTTTSTTSTTPHPPPPSTTSEPFGPICYSYKKQPVIRFSTQASVKRCEVGEVCSLYWEDTGYTAKCLPKNFCYSTKYQMAIAGSGECWECCESHLCNSKCSGSLMNPTCKDKPQCYLMMSTSYNVCGDPAMSQDLCRRTCHLCT